MLERIEMTEPTPLILSERMSESIGLPFYIKRDDMCGVKYGYPGTHMRKLEFLIVELAAAKCSDVVLSGSIHSNFNRAVAGLCSHYGLTLHLVYLDSGANASDSNNFLSQLYGATLYGYQPKEFVFSLHEMLTDQGRTVALIHPEGARSSAISAGLSLFTELEFDLEAAGVSDPITVYVGSDSGATQAGMIYGHSVSAKNFPIKIIGVPVFGDPQSQTSRVIDNLSYIDSKLGCNVSISAVEMSDILLPRAEMHYDIPNITRWFLHNTQILLDPIYGIHTATALIPDIQDKKLSGPVVFVNPCLPTNIFAHADYYRQVFEAEYMALNPAQGE